jgi:ATP-dependent Clp protease protease subunit
MEVAGVEPDPNTCRFVATCASLFRNVPWSQEIINSPVPACSQRENLGVGVGDRTMPDLQIPPNTPVLYVVFSAEINPNTCESLVGVMSEATNQKVGAVYLALTTPGGNVREGMHLYNVLKGMPFDLAMHNVGSVDSIGNAVFLAGKTRYSVANATFTYHGVGFNIGTTTRLEEQHVREYLGSILADQKKIGGVISANSNLNPRQGASLFRRQQTKDAAWAVDKGIIHEIREFQIPPGGPVVSLVFKR